MQLSLKRVTHVLPYVFSTLKMVWVYLQHATTRYPQTYKKYIYSKICLKNITVTRGDALRIVQNQKNHRRKYTVTRVVTASRCGNAFH